MQSVMKESWELQYLLNDLAGKGRVAPADPPAAVDVVVVPCEINQRHGTGVLLQRIFGESRDVVVIYSMSLYQQENLAGGRVLNLSHQGLSRQEVYANVLKAVRGMTVRRVLCVPFFPDDALTAIALKELFQAPLCTYLMDDNNLYSRGMPDGLMRELLAKSALRFAISPEMRAAYETKYRHKIWFVPAVVSDEQIVATPLPASRMSQGRTTGVVIGNIWDQQWLDLLPYLGAPGEPYPALVLHRRLWHAEIIRGGYGPRRDHSIGTETSARANRALARVRFRGGAIRASRRGQ